jgi:hydroxymethylbilane synthase
MTQPPASLPSAARQILRLGSRGSPLALVQANMVADAIMTASGGAVTAEIKTFTTSGDRLTSERLIAAGGKGLFTREIDIALSAGDIDIAVHSLKDVPTRLPEGQRFLAIPAREDPREGFVSHIASALADLPQGAVVGTASLRREAQTRAARPDLAIVTFRGNIATRLKKLEAGEAHATYLALAGLTRLGLAHLAHPVALTQMLPAAAQGLLGIVGRDDLDGDIRALIATLNDTAGAAAAAAERAFLAGLDGSCRTPIAAHLFDDGDTWRLAGEVLQPDGSARWRASATCRKSATRVQLRALGASVAADIREAAGGALPAFEDGV